MATSHKSRSGPVTVIKPDGSVELRENASFRKPKIDEQGLCTRCSTPVHFEYRHYTFKGRRCQRRVLMESYGFKGQEHVCPQVVRARAASLPGPTSPAS